MFMMHVKHKASLLLMTGLLLATTMACKTKDPITSEPPVETSTQGDDTQTVTTVEVEIIEKPVDVYVDALPMTPIYFGYDKSNLDDADKMMIERAAEWLNAHPGVTVTLEGHTDEPGSEEYNKDLGMERAQAVYDYLIELGVSSDRLEAVSKGETDFAVPQNDNQRLWKNRRVEFEQTGM